MDIFSHGLWGAAVFGRNKGIFTKKKFWTAFIFGIAPDLFSFGILFIQDMAHFMAVGNFRYPHDMESGGMHLPQYVFSAYNVTHSLFVFIVAFFLLWAIFKKPIWESLAWGLHILVDIPTHSHLFFPTPFLWPFSNFTFDGWPWGSPWIFFPNVLALLSVYFWFYFVKKR